MSDRREELGLSERAPWILLLLLGLALPASAQEEPEIRGFFGAGGSVSRLHGDAAPFLEVEAGLALSPRLRVGGTAFVLPSPRASGSVALQELELVVGYGGLFVEALRDAPVGGGDWYARLLLGAGNADVRDAATSLRLDSDNFFVVAPSVGVVLPPWRRFSVSAGFSWRFVGGVQDLRGVEASDLGGPSLHLRVRCCPL